jgi:hypothetical protein
VFAYCKQNAKQIFMACAVLLLVPSLLSDALLLGFGNAAISQPWTALLAIGGGLAAFAVTLLTTGISATVYREAERVHQKGLPA